MNTLIRTQPDFVQALKDGGVDVDTPLLKDLQEAHDGSGSLVKDVGFDKAMKDFEKRMRKVANVYDLVYTKP